MRSFEGSLLWVVEVLSLSVMPAAPVTVSVTPAAPVTVAVVLSHQKRCKQSGLGSYNLDTCQFLFAAKLSGNHDGTSACSRENKCPSLVG